MSIHVPSTNMPPRSPAQSTSRSTIATAVRLVLIAFITLGLPVLYALSAIPYMSAGYDLSKAQLNVTGAPGAYILFTLSLSSAVSGHWSTSGITAQLQGINQKLTVIPAREQDWSDSIEGKANTTRIDGALLLPSSVSETKDLIGTVTGAIDYPRASSFNDFQTSTIPISVSLHIKLISGQEMFFQSGRALLYGVGILGTLLLGGFFLLLRLYNRVTKMSPLLASVQGFKSWQGVIYLYQFYLLVILGTSFFISLDTPAPKNEVFLLATIMAAAAFLAVLIYIIGMYRTIQQTAR
ncbi:hypothetical protein KDA_31390 [Dictyobacter alpinus]|uniref:Uncharacterized protein n=1 Tax=Dictyobacter alpinus TaxID=2014873 RepID=A0A402B8I1_9CHLR|nr:hypothetical protein [Dictyobacter alpinus]GCE27655.1 hypothetical protein KDA_31390 [Dictyobacter alpinus]